MFTYQIDEKNAIWGYAPNQTEPCLFQPDWPDTTPWKDKEEAENWAKTWIAHMTNPEKNNPPASSP